VAEPQGRDNLLLALDDGGLQPLHAVEVGALLGREVGSGLPASVKH
jgi:hypothetical protein